jgi:hypothetical protein
MTKRTGSRDVEAVLAFPFFTAIADGLPARAACEFGHNRSYLGACWLTNGSRSLRFAGLQCQLPPRANARSWGCPQPM